MIAITSTVAFIEGRTYIVRKTLLFGMPVRTSKMEVPSNGDLVRITWLPGPSNTSRRSAYVGAVGIVQDLCEDGSFCLRLSGGGLLVVGPRYRFDRNVNRRIDGKKRD